MSGPGGGRHLVMPRMTDADKIGLKKAYLVQIGERLLLPVYVSLIKYSTPARDQGVHGTCTIFAVMALAEMFRPFGTSADESEAYVWYNAAVFIDKRGPGAYGFYTKTVASAMISYGIIGETQWSYAAHLNIPGVLQQPDGALYSGG